MGRCGHRFYSFSRISALKTDSSTLSKTCSTPFSASPGFDPFLLDITPICTQPHRVTALSQPSQPIWPDMPFLLTQHLWPSSDPSRAPPTLSSCQVNRLQNRVLLLQRELEIVRGPGRLGEPMVPEKLFQQLTTAHAKAATLGWWTHVETCGYRRVAV